MIELNALTCPLEGTYLIEAAAGTGKTYNIQTLILRLVLQKGIPIGKILVVTYTDAAAAELRTRISKILHEAGVYLKNKEPQEKKVCEARILSVINEAQKTVPDKELINRIDDALLNFDESPIQTIHGFCNSMLHRNAFESGVLFRTEPKGDPKDLINTYATNAYRRLFYSEKNSLASEIFRSKKLDNIDAFLKVFQRFVYRPELKVVGESRNTESELRNAIADFRANIGPESLDILKDEKSIKIELIRTMISDETVSLCAEALNVLRILTPDILPTFVEKSIPSDDPNLKKLYFYAGRIVHYAESFFNYTFNDLRSECINQLERQKIVQNFITFNDLLVLLHKAVTAPASPLSALISKDYYAAIVDEFQDTDRIQFEIFKTVFSMPGHAFFMVGDPRQAIYSFRGGDIFMYKQVSEWVEPSHHYSLVTNYRSSPDVIHAVNLLFSSHANPFVDSKILFHDVHIPVPSPESPGIQPLLFQGVPYKTPVSFLSAEKDLEVVCAQEIFNLLSSGKWHIPASDKVPEHTVSPSEIAVLCRTGIECIKVHDSLSKLGIPSTLSKSGNIYNSEAAIALKNLLSAVLDPADRKKLYAALLTPCIGLNIRELCDKEKISGILDTYVLKMLELREAFDQNSFIGFFKKMNQLFELDRRLLGKEDGDRFLTDFLQLRDLLHEETMKKHLTLESVFDYLSNAINNESEDETVEKQLETDRPAVKIMTIHKSKGLEFPFVFLPFLQSLKTVGKQVTYHIDSQVYALTATENTNHNESQLETLQEYMRLVYVAITRAKYFCRIYYKKSKSESALDWLLRCRKIDDPELSRKPAKLIAFLNEQNAKLDFSEVVPDELKGLFTDTMIEGGETFKVDVPVLAAPESIGWHDAASVLRAQIQLSFSFLNGGALSPVDHDDVDDRDTRHLLSASVDRPVFHLPFGEAFGNAVHATMDKLDFSSRHDELAAVCEKQLNRFGMLRGESKNALLNTVVSMLESALAFPFDRHAGQSFMLKGIPRQNCISEMRFDYRLKNVFTSKDVAFSVSEYVKKRFSLSVFTLPGKSALQGMMTGAIDLFFFHEGRCFILDWKTNWINGQIENFNESGLIREMAHKHYFLQELIYALAVMKYLSMRSGLPMKDAYEKYFGGVYYAFLRGMTEPGHGLFYDKPPFEVIEKLNKVIG